MASESKKRKAKNSYLYNGGTRLDLKMKRIAYYTKRDRNKLKKIDLYEQGGTNSGSIVFDAEKGCGEGLI